MNNFICKIFGHKYIQVIEIRVIEFLWKKKEITKTICKHCKKTKGNLMNPLLMSDSYKLSHYFQQTQVLNISIVI